MSMKGILIGFGFLLLISVSPLRAAEGISPATMENYRKTKVTLEQLFTAKAGIYAKDILEGARRNLARAQEGIEAKKEKAARQALEMTALQMEQAEAKAQEREAAEKTAVTRAKVDKLEQKLTNILAGKGDEQ